MRNIVTSVLAATAAPVLAATLAFGALGCNSHTAAGVGGAAVGAGGVGAAYEYQNKKALEELEDDYEAGRISKREYLDRKEEIEKRSVVY
jgi:hypothetical protein